VGTNELLCHELSIPAHKRIGRDKRGDLVHTPTSKRVREHGMAAALGRRKRAIQYTPNLNNCNGVKSHAAAIKKV
jgi:hypothetical protein